MEDAVKEVLNDKKNKLLEAKSHILRMPNNKKRVEMLDAYYDLLHYYCHGSYDFVRDNYAKFGIEYGNDKYLQCVFQNTLKNLEEIKTNAAVLYDKYQKIIDIYKENEFCMYCHSGLMKTKPKLLEKAVWDFLESLGDDVLNIYYNMILGGNILSTPEDMENYLGVSYNTNPIDNPSVVLLNIPHSLQYYFTIVHEMGHCYQFYLQRNQREYASFSPYCEVTSILFELLFKEYLINNHIIKDDFKINMENHASLLRYSSITKVLCNEFKNDDFKGINPFDLSYSVKRPMEELQKEVDDDCVNLFPMDSDVDISLMQYAFGRVIAMYYLEKLKNNFDEEWKNYKNFICTMNYLPLSDVIDEVFDVDIVEKDIKKFVKSYHER